MLNVGDLGKIRAHEIGLGPVIPVVAFVVFPGDLDHVFDDIVALCIAHVDEIAAFHLRLVGVQLFHAFKVACKIVTPAVVEPYGAQCLFYEFFNFGTTFFLLVFGIDMHRHGICFAGPVLDFGHQALFGEGFHVIDVIDDLFDFVFDRCLLVVDVFAPQFPGLLSKLTVQIGDEQAGQDADGNQRQRRHAVQEDLVYAFSCGSHCAPLLALP